MDNLIVIAISISALVLAFVELFKITFNINKRFIPLTAVIVGAIFGALAYFLDVVLADRIWIGVIAGLMASGLFDNGKSAKEVIKND